ncbi:uncharacterized protein MONOS_14420 [Monocercomonoides exilis]|uniref:uncharacterized protein n=1 Tax=Monocercomonoides exilis TaxID=2049356 RepID=UPI00355ABBFE|nr:hypothetical protein MONOS_14420 [Monocercomonoides exilis]|eukprot:MONOS_14420.1-p1 / transcript=MONOS_14420.1 / gene=MONOS_14420 / organism=Monocercomonoides_exilis_PA203 / gene_product=unspecified product / transcript_product=unspecified product / location=Mono_scaffold00998:11397-11767(+) / protein_length=104 / sequence_SO=supercontig / SO=protein_coding / is_pseudo=false
MSSSTPRDRLLLDSKTFTPASSHQVEGALVRAEGCSISSLEMNTTAFQGSRALGCDAGRLIGVSLGSWCHLSAAGCEFDHGECKKKTDRVGAPCVKSTDTDAC